jgi:hypothetical protein
VALAERTDHVDEQGNTQLDLAEILTLAGRPEAAASAATRAITYCEVKGNLVSGEEARTLVDRLAGRVAGR